jgi:AsmA protein
VTSFEHEIGFDVRFSAAKAMLGPLPLQNAAVSLVSNANQARIEIIDSELHNGALRGFVNLNAAPTPGADMRLQLKNLDFETLTRDLSLPFPPFFGSGSMELSLHLAEPLAVATPEDMTGTLRLTVDNGNVPGISLTELRRLASSKAYFALSEARGGGMDFTRLNVTADINAGKAEIQEARLDGAQQSISLSGVVPYETKSLALSATVTDNAGSLAPLNLFVGGAWPNPILWPVARAESKPSP